MSNSNHSRQTGMGRYVYLYMAIRALLKIAARCDVSSFYVIE